MTRPGLTLASRVRPAAVAASTRPGPAAMRRRVTRQGSQTGSGGPGTVRAAVVIRTLRDSGTCRTEIRLALGRLRPPLGMRLDIDCWSSSSTAVALIPCGHIRPTAAYFRAGHLLLDWLTRSLPQHLPQRMYGNL